MVELHHVVGAILRDISQARVTSDVYSRNISRYYEQDALLRRFPTPRSEIDEVDLSLKFVLSGIEFNPSQNEGRESSTATILASLSFSITQSFFESLLDCAGELLTAWPETEKKLKSTEHRIYLQQDILQYLQRNVTDIVVSNKVQYKEIVHDLHTVLQGRFQLLADSSEFTKKQIDTVTSKALKQLRLEDRLGEQEEALKFAWHEQGDMKVTVDVTAQELIEIPEHLISTLQIKTSMRNYIWSKVEHEGREWRALNPE